MERKNRAAPDNPCQKEQDGSYKCLSQNHYDKDICEPHFINYLNCQKFWTSIKQERRRKGISPELPPAEERDKIKAEFMERQKNRAH